LIKKSRFNAVIFDIDGTLVSTGKLIFASFNHVTRKYLGKEFAREEIIELFGPTEDVILKEWMGDKYFEARADYYKFYSDNHEEMTHTIPGLAELIEEIKQSGIRLGIFTGKGCTSSKITLEKLGILNLFERHVTGDDVAEFKPSPEGLIALIDEFNIKPENLLMVGDAPVDVMAAKAAGCKSASVLWDGHPLHDEEVKGDFSVNSVDDLRKVIFN
jgi:HAD superfamily hydrolase (TIGR01509 family)